MFGPEMHIQLCMLGAAVWFSPLFCCACLLWGAVCGSVMTTYAGVVGMTIFWVLQLGVMLAHLVVTSPAEPPPLQLPQIGLYGRSWPCVLLSRVLLRSRKLKDVAAAGVLLLATTVSAAAFVYLYPRMRALPASYPPSLAFSCLFGLALGLVHTLQHLGWCRDVLAFPLIHRHRYFRIRHCLPQVLISSLRIASVALLLTALLKPNAASSQSIHSSSRDVQSVVWGGMVLSRHLSALLSALHAGSLWVFGWLAGHATLAIVLTEPPRLVQQQEGQQGAAETLLKALATPNPIFQDLALMEFAEIAEGATVEHAAQRADVFADETGRLGWTPLAGFLVEELRDFAGGLGAALSAMSGELSAPAKPSAGGPQRVRWNVLSAPHSLGGAKLGKEQDRAAWSVRAKYYRVGFCLRALSGMATASRAEDRFGVVLLCEPLLADVLACLLSLVLVLQQYTKQESGYSARSQGSFTKYIESGLQMVSPPPHPKLQQPELCAHALEDAARTALYRVVRTFGSSLQPLLKESGVKQVMPQGDLAKLLQRVLAQQE